MLYQSLADGVMLAHLGFVAFVVIGGAAEGHRHLRPGCFGFTPRRLGEGEGLAENANRRPQIASGVGNALRVFSRENRDLRNVLQAAANGPTMTGVALRRTVSSVARDA